MYAKKVNALFYEFEEVGMNKQLGYSSPADRQVSRAARSIEVARL